MNRGFLREWAFLFFLGSLSLTASSQELGVPAPVTTGSATTVYASVKVEGRALFDIMGVGELTAEERADRVSRRLRSLIARQEPMPPFSRKNLVSDNNATVINLGGDPILSVTDGDGQDALTTHENLAFQWGQEMASAVKDARSVRSNPFTGSGILIRNSFSDLLVSLLKWLPRLAGVIVLLLLFALFARFNRWAVKSVTARTRLDSNIRRLLREIVYYGTWIIGILAILSTLGLEWGSIATTLGISGFILGFAFKDILSHFFAGLMILLGRQFHIGDQIVIKEYEGTVERIELRALYLRTYDNRLVIIPNGDVFTSIVTSNTASPLRRREFLLGIGCNNNIAEAQAVILETLRGVEGVAEEPAPDVLVDALTASTINLRALFYTASKRADYMRVGSECMRRVKEDLDLNHISMPTDIQTIVIQNLDDLINKRVQSENGSIHAADAITGHDGSKPANP
jgi:small conductance mechanosensitive channel